MIIKRSAPLSLATMMLLSTVSSLAFANPQDGVVAAGAAVISSSGPAMDIHQSTDRAVIDWRSFNIGANESTTFHQPAATSITVNRVNAASPSQIQGALKANGNLVIINPNGVVFDRGSQVDVNGLVATTSDIDNQQFMSGGPLVLSKPGNPNATVANHGTITAKDAGLVGLVAPNVVNSGVINARLGRAELASGDSATLDFYGDGLLEIKASDALQSQLIENTGSINAAGGVITLTAAAGREQVNSVIKVDGELNAPGIGTKEGKIIIFAEGSHAVKPGDTPDVKTGRSTVFVTGKLNVSNATGKGGTVTVAADQIAIMSGAKIDATGRDGGGRVTVGGDGHVPNISTDFVQPVMVAAAPAQAPTPTSLITILQSDALIDVSATGNGHGGQVSVWADDRTEFNGRIDANGEGNGDGGFVETSGRVALLSYGQVNATTRRGRKGTWLLDPADIEITAATNSNNTGVPNFTATGGSSQVSAASIVSQLDAGTDVIIMTTNDGFAGNGDIFVNSAIVSTGSGSLTLRAYRDVSVTRAITLQGGDLVISGASVSIANGAPVTTGGTGDITFYANSLSIAGSTVVTAGGAMTLAAFSPTYGVSLGASVANTLNIADADFAKLSADSYVFGSTTTMDGATNTGNVIINTTHDFGDANLSFIAGNDVLLNGSLFQTSSSGTTNYLMRAVRHIANASGMGMFSLGGGFNLELDSDSDNNSDGTITWNGGTVINAAAGLIVVRDAMNIAGTFSMATNGITLHGTVDGDTVGTRSVSFDAKTGTFNNLAAIGSIRQLANLSISADNVVIAGNLHGTGALSIQPRNNNRLMRVEHGADDGTALHINSTELGHIQNDWSQVNFGILSSATAYLDVGAVAFNNNVNLRGWRTRLYGALEMLGFTNISFQPQDVELHAGSSITTNGGNVNVTPGISIHAANRTITTNGGFVLINGSLTSAIAAPGTFTIDTDNGAIVIGNNTNAITAGAMTSGGYVLDAGFGPVELRGAVNMPGDLTITGSSFTGGDMGGSTALNAVSISTVGAITLPSINATSIFARNTGATADITIASGKTLTATGSGNALVLAAGRNFINLSNGSALSAASGRWLVYSANPANNTRGGLLPDASNFNMTYTGNPPAGIGSGNRLIYSRVTAPTVTLVTDADTVIYGNTYGIGDFSYQYGSGLVGGDSWGSIGLTGSAGFTSTYGAGTTDAGAQVGMINGTVGTLSSVLGYSFAFTAGDLNVTQRSLTVNTANASKYLSQSDPVFVGSDNLLAGDAAQIIWGYAPVGYGGGVGSYTIAAVATDPLGRLNNYVRVDNYGSFTVLADIIVTPPPPPPPPIANDVPDTVLRGFAVPILPLLNPAMNIPAATRSAAAADDAQESDEAKAEYRADAQNGLLGGWELYRIGPRLQAILDI